MAESVWDYDEQQTRELEELLGQPQSVDPALEREGYQYDPEQMQSIEDMLRADKERKVMSEALQRQRAEEKQASMSHEPMDPSLLLRQEQPAQAAPKNLDFLRQQPATGQQPGLQLRGLGVPGTGRIKEIADFMKSLPEKQAEAAKDASEGLGLAYDKMKTASELVSETKSYFAQQQADILEAGNDAMLELTKRLTERRDKAQKEVDRARMNFMDEINEQAKEKPIEGWGFGKKFGAAIAMALGALGSSYSGGPNQAMAAIKLGMERDAEEHRRLMAQRKGRLESKNMLYNIASRNYTDVESQILAAKAQQLEDVQRQVNLVTAKSASAITRAQGAELKQKLELEKRKFLEDLNQKQLTQKMVMGSAALAPEKTLFDARSMQAQLRGKAAELAQKQAMEQETIPGAYFTGRATKEDIKEGKKIMAKFNPAVRVLDDFIAWRKKPYSERILPEERARGEQLINDLVNTGKVYEEYGARLEPSELKALGAPDSANEYGWILARLEQKRDSMVNRTQAELSGYNIGLNRAKKLGRKNK